MQPPEKVTAHSRINTLDLCPLTEIWMHLHEDCVNKRMDWRLRKATLHTKWANGIRHGSFGIQIIIDKLNLIKR